MDGGTQIIALFGLAALCLPFFHALRSKDGLTVFGTAALCLAAAAVATGGKSVIHEILAALLWIAAYLGAMIADQFHRIKR